MSLFDKKPESFFDLIAHDLSKIPGLTGVCSGYESEEWRYEALADYLFEWLPEFALRYSDLEGINSATAMRLMKRAAKTVYTTEKYGKRGEFGELLLHALIREVFNSQPVISKIYYKCSANDPVKGFDAVHVIENDKDLELWLGEVKFYKDITQAIHDIKVELAAHTDRDYLRSEFIAIESKIDSKWPHAEKVQKLISQRTSLDEVFKRTCFPVLLTYDSDVVAAHTQKTEEYTQKLKKELLDIYDKFIEKGSPPIRIHLFLVPLKSKEVLIKVLHDKLEGLQR